MKVIVGDISIVFEYGEKVLRLAMDREFKEADIKAVFDYIKADNGIVEYETGADTAQQCMMLNVGGEPRIFTKMPI
jgi:hypothetical protein